MGLTTERKVFLGLACVAGLALVIDQGFLATKQASADTFPEGMSVSDELQAQPEAAPATTPMGKPAAMVLIDRLATIASPDQRASLGSSFSLTRLIEPSPSNPITDAALASGQPGEQGEGAESGFPLIAPAAPDLPVLSSVMPAKNGGGAVLGGKLLRVGQVDPHGYRLVLVHERSVLVERDGVQYAIEIPVTSGQE